MFITIILTNGQETHVLINGLRQELRQELRKETHGLIYGLRKEMHGLINDLRTSRLLIKSLVKLLQK